MSHGQHSGECMKPSSSILLGLLKRVIGRRSFIRLAAGCALSLTNFKRAFAADTLDPSEVKNYRISGEFEPTRAIWLGYDQGHVELTVALVKALSEHVAIKLVAIDLATRNAARELLASRGVRLENIQFLIEPGSLFFVRDVAVFMSGAKGELGTVNFRWQYYGLSGWCRRRFMNRPDRINSCVGSPSTAHNDLALAFAKQAGVPSFQSNLVIEGGAIEVNGKGLILANEALLQQRNPGKSRALLEREYKRLPGIRKVVWLPEGLAEDPHLRATIVGNYVGWGTGGHTDEFVRFVDAKTVMLAWPSDADVAAHPVSRLNRSRMQRCFDVLSRTTDIDGQGLKVLKVPMPKVIEKPLFLSAAADRAWSHEWTADYFPESERRREGDRVIQVAAASYMNFVIANGVVVVPSYVKHGTARSTEARVMQLFQEAFPNRQIQFIDAITANWTGGGPHCATLREPAA
jgi:agmatine deiminase